MTSTELYRWLGYRPARDYAVGSRPMVVLGVVGDLHFAIVDPTVMREALGGRLVAGKLERVTAPRHAV